MRAVSSAAVLSLGHAGAGGRTMPVRVAARVSATATLTVTIR